MDGLAYVSRGDVAGFIGIMILAVLWACSIVAIDYWVWRRPPPDDCPMPVVTIERAERFQSAARTEAKAEQIKPRVPESSAARIVGACLARGRAARSIAE
jgi:hypothetical protein